MSQEENPALECARDSKGRNRQGLPGHASSWAHCELAQNRTIVGTRALRPVLIAGVSAGSWPRFVKDYLHFVIFVRVFRVGRIERDGAEGAQAGETVGGLAYEAVARIPHAPAALPGNLLQGRGRFGRGHGRRGCRSRGTVSPEAGEISAQGGLTIHSHLVMVSPWRL
jgi:hypothetical protein